MLGLPQGLGLTIKTARMTAHDEEGIGQTVEVGHRLLANGLLLGQSYGEALGASAYGAGQMKVGRHPASAGKNEATQLGKRLVPCVEIRFEASHVTGFDHGLLGVPVCGQGGEVAAEIEKLVLNAFDHFGKRGGAVGSPR